MHAYLRAHVAAGLVAIGLRNARARIPDGGASAGATASVRATRTHEVWSITYVVCLADGVKGR